MNKKIFDKIKELKQVYALEGFIIVGVFGSFARNEETGKSDVDILYDLSDEFKIKFRGFSAINKLDAIKSGIEKKLGRNVDIVNRNAIGSIGKKYIIPEAVSVG